MTEQNPILKAALAYGRAGLSIYPSPRKDGAAYVKWRTCSTTDAATITQWWAQWPEALICLDCGKSEVGVIDVDTLEGHDVDGLSALLDLELANELLPLTRQAQSPSKGVHYFFRDPGALLKTTSGKLGPGLDTRGRGGMVVLTPSVVKGKGVYQWLNKEKMAPIPQWVLDLVGAPNDYGTAPDAEFEPVYTQEEFKERLNLLNVDDFREHDKWLSLMLACTHSSTVLDGKEAFMDWTTGNGEGEFAGDWDIINDRWDYNFGQNRNKAGKAARVGTFNKFLTDAGFGDRVQRQPDISASDEFDDDDRDTTLPEPKDKKAADARARAQKEGAERAAKRAKIKALRRIRAIRVVKSLLDKTVANGCTADEAASSQAKAAEMIEEYKLTVEELTDDLPPNSAEEEAAAEFKDIPTGATEQDFHHYGPTNVFIFEPTGDMWPPGSLSTLFPKGVTKRIAANRPLQQATWAPGSPKIIRDKLIMNGTWTPQPGATVFNLYRPPIVGKLGDPAKAGPWLDHVAKIYPDEAAHILGFFAWRVQRPDVKINHAIVLGGDPGIGKDTMIAGLRQAVGPWNTAECSPTQLLGDYVSKFLQAVILRVNEARDLGGDGAKRVSRYDFYEGTKTFMADPPETLSVQAKYLNWYDIMNLVGILITTNNKMNGLFLPPDDRRHYIGWSKLTEADFAIDDDGNLIPVTDARFKAAVAAYFNKLWAWYTTPDETGATGFDHVAAYLRCFDRTLFDPKATPPKTNAFWEIVGANRPPEDTELANLLLEMGSDLFGENPQLPAAITVEQIIAAASRRDEDYNELFLFLSDRKNRRQLAARLERAGYSKLSNPDETNDGQWVIGGKRVNVYILKTMSPVDGFKAVRQMQKAADRAKARATATA